MLAVGVGILGPVLLAVLPVTAAHAATGTPPQVVCPPGSSDPVYCSDYCPDATLVGGLCVANPDGSDPSTEVSATTATSSGKTVLPQGSPVAYHWQLWGAKLSVSTGTALKFKLDSGAGGSPDLKSIRLLLPAGLTFAQPAVAPSITGGVKQLGTTDQSMIVRLSSGRPTLAISVENHALLESSELRSELASGAVKALTFRLEVTNAAGRRTDLAFAVAPRS